MGISAMKQAVDAITNVLAGSDFDNPYADLKEAATALQHAIDMSEKHVHKSDKHQLIKQAEEAFESAKERGWVGLDPEMMRNTPIEFNRGALWAERWLKEKNHG